MEYFAIGHDQRLDSFGSQILFSDRVLNGFAETEEQEMAFLRQGRKLEYRSVIENPVYLVSMELCEILSGYEPEMKYKNISIIDQDTHEQALFCLIDVPVIDCISQAHSVIDRGVIREPVLDEQKIRNRSMFWVADFPTRSLIVRLDVAEGLLRKSLYGLDIQRVQTWDGDM